MIRQVRATLFFIDDDEAEDFYHDCELAWAKASDLNPGSLNTEYSIIELIENHHDEAPNAPCDVLRRKCSYPPPPD